MNYSYIIVKSCARFFYLSGIFGLMDVLAALTALAVWGIVLLVSSLATSLVAQFWKIENKFALGVTVQVLYALLSVMAASSTGNLDRMGLALDVPLSLIALAAAVAVGLPLAFVASKLGGDYRPAFISEDIRERLVLALVFAPLGEELLFRGLLEGMLLASLNLWLAVVIPALLFSIIHVVPFSDSPKTFLSSLLISALLVGLLAGYLRAISDSLLPAIAVHAGFNLAGNLVDWFAGRHAVP